MTRFTFVMALVVGIAATLLLSQPVMAQSASTQVVFSGTGSGTFGGKTTHFGFWIWCEGGSSNPYVGACNGAMYFYALGITRPVSGTATGSGSLFSMTVHSPGKTPAVSCTLNNPNTPVSGPHNTVDVSCSAPSGSGSTTNAVVVVTGP